jgi:hypothetical protein
MEKNKMKFMENIKSVFTSEITEDSDRGDLVQTIIITAGFAVAGFLMINWIATAVLDKGHDVSECVENSAIPGTNNRTPNCDKKTNTLSKVESWKNHK